MLRDLIQAYPELAAVAVLVLGIGLGKLAAVMTRRLLSLTDRVAARYSGGDRTRISPVFQQAASVFVFIVVLALAIIVAVRLLDIDPLSGWLDALLAYVPRFILGLLIIGAGTVLGTLTRTLIASLMAQGDANALLPRLAQVGVVLIAFVTGLQQIGIDISFITQLSLIVLAALLGGLSIAFALGAKQYVANLMAQSELARYSTGDRLRIDEDEGEIVEIHRTGLTLATDEGLVSIPAARLTSGRVLQLTDNSRGD
ncbi:mechanosensitive ion channel family protein [Wenzhouxiangella sp. EGI_FJ10305]|uniref:mechanosensitive ion channel family protein n=1 Tax=Wenzhouxiangella sp. EGI_FJ10305 TaxID=3243768 RepID=UPI0035D630A6